MTAKKALPAQERPLPLWLLALTVVFCGTGVIMIELLGSRIVGPFFGVSLFIWTALISVALIGLSVGYFLGGVVADRYPTAKGMYSIIGVAVVFTLLIPLYDREVCLAFSDPERIRSGLLIASMILFLPPLTALGFVSPYALRLAIQSIDHTGRTAGLLYALSTVGSVMGSVLTGFYLIPLLGVSKTLVLIAAILAVPIVVWALVVRRPVRAGAVAGGTALLCLLATVRAEARVLPVSSEFRLLAEEEGRYALVSIMESLYPTQWGEGWVRWIIIDGIPQTGVFAPDQETVPERAWFTNYTPLHEVQFHFFRLHGRPLQRVAVIGLGGGAVPMALTREGVQVDVVDIDATVVEMAEEWMGFDTGAVNMHVMDGRAFVRSAEGPYDAVIFDVATGGSQPFHLFSLELFEETAEILAPDGVVAMNYIGFPEGENDFLSSAVYNTVTQIFPHAHAYVYPTNPRPDQLCNMMFFFSRTPLPSDQDLARDLSLSSEDRRMIQRQFLRLLDPDFDGVNHEGESVILTDDWNPIEAYSTQINEVWRQQIFASMPREALFRF